MDKILLIENVNVCPECSVRGGLVDNITMLMTYITTLPLHSATHTK